MQETVNVTFQCKDICVREHSSWHYIPLSVCLSVCLSRFLSLSNALETAIHLVTLFFTIPTL